MKNIILSDNQYDELCLEIAKLVNRFKKRRNIDSIYFNVFDSLGVMSDVINLNMVIYNYDNGFIEEIERLNKEIYETKNSLSRFGIKIYLSYGILDNYCLIPNGISNILLARDLYSSIILFDKTGKLTELKNKQIEIEDDSIKDIIFEYSNLGTIKPVIDKDTINKSANKLNCCKLLKNNK